MNKFKKNVERLKGKKNNNKNTTFPKRDVMRELSPKQNKFKLAKVISVIFIMLITVFILLMVKSNNKCEKSKLKIKTSELQNLFDLKKKNEKYQEKTDIKEEDVLKTEKIIINAKVRNCLTENYIDDVDPNSTIPTASEDGLGDGEFWDNFTPKGIGTFIVSAAAWIFRAVLFLIIGAILNTIGLVISLTGGKLGVLTIENVLFNEIPLIDPSFWASPFKKIETFYSGTAVIIKWIMLAAIVIQIFVLLIITIKAIIRTVSLKTYVNKKQLETDISKIFMDWVVGFIILFGVVFYAAIVIAVNNEIVKILYESIKYNNGLDLTDALRNDIFSLNIMKGTVAFLMYVMIKIQAIALFFKYVTRFIKLMFLLMISPLIASTYAIDRMSDGESQALKTWNKLFVQTVAMQVIHVLIYVTTVSVLISPGNDSFSVAGLIISVLGVNFIWTAESIIYKMFNVDRGITGDLLKGNAKIAQTLIWDDTKKRKLTQGIGVVKKGTSKLGETKLGKKVTGFTSKTKDTINTAVIDVKDKTRASIVGRGYSKAKDLKSSASTKYEEIRENVLMMPTTGVRKIKEKAHTKLGVQIPKERYDLEELNRRRNIKLKREEKLKRKAGKRKTRKKRIIKGFATHTAAAGTLAVTLSTRNLEMSDFVQSRVKGRMIVDAVNDNLNDKNPKPKKLPENLQSSQKRRLMQQKYEEMYNNYQRKGESKLSESDKGSVKHDVKQREAIKNMLISARMKEELSGQSFDPNETEGIDNLEIYDKAFEKTSPQETAQVLDKQVKKSESDLEKFLSEKLEKDKKEIELILTQLKTLVEEGVSIKGSVSSPEVNNYISSLVDQRYFIDREQYEAITEDFNGNFTEDILNEYLENREKYKEEEKRSKIEYEKESFDIDKYFDV